MKILLVTPPLIQLNTPYPATTMLTAFLLKNGYETYQCDLGIELIEKVFTKEFLSPLFEEAFYRDKLSVRAKAVALNRQKYLDTIDSVIPFLQGKDDTLSTRIASREFLPEATRFKKVDDDDLDWAFGSTGQRDKAKHLASLYLVDLTDFISEMVSENFNLIRYGEQIALSAPTFDRIEKSLNKEPINRIDKIMLSLLDQKIAEVSPDVIGFSIPFPGTLYAALKCGQHIKQTYKNIKIIAGGGYVSTELRDITDTSIFNYVDYLTYDDGELPLYRLCEFFEKKAEEKDLVRTKYIVDNKIFSCSDFESNIAFEQLPAPTYKGLKMDKYISMIEFTNPMHKLWSDGKWLKLTMAHGCYWAKCTFCDTSLDYICRYDAPQASVVVDKIESMTAETGISGIHFTDEALPPKLLFEVCEQIIKRGLVISFWGNIRFEKSFTLEKCQLLAKAGCIAISGGIEVASDRILKLIDKGITVETAAKTAHNFTESGIMVHAYLMYGFPSQTYSECVDSLEIVRQMFEQGVLQSGFWHRYTMTCHSITAKYPNKFAVERLDNTLNPFANNSLRHKDIISLDFNKINKALQGSIYNYMQGIGYDIPLKNWFEDKEAIPTIDKNLIKKIIES